MTNINYKELLIKYMGLVIDNEGISFIEYGCSNHAGIKFTEQEIKELENIDTEARRREAEASS
jgi:hypothetical protein